MTKSSSIIMIENKSLTESDSRGRGERGESMKAQYVTADELVDTLGVKQRESLPDYQTAQ